MRSTHFGGFIAPLLIVDLLEVIGKRTDQAMEALKAHLAKSAFTERFLVLADTKNFVLRCYPSLQVEDVRLAEKMGRSGG